ncbi:MAG: Ig-like domain-containing protein [Tepidisphaeraceae bacterium]|jgi:plastocyanin
MRQSFFDQKPLNHRARGKRRRPVAFCLESLQPRILFSSSPKTVGNIDDLLAVVSDSQVANPQVTPNQPPTVAVPAAAFPSEVTGTSTILSILGADDGGESNLTYTWSTQGAVPAPVTFSANGTNSAKNVTATFTQAGNYVFLATITDSGGLTTTSTVPVDVVQMASSIVVTPTSASVEVNGTEQFTATEYDQFGQPMPAPPTNQLTWTLASGSGSLNSTGNYIAPLTVGSATAEVISGSLSASASVSIQDSAPVVSQIAASPLVGTSNTTNLSVTATGDSGPANLTYSWVVLSKPAGARTPGFTVNGTNSSNNTTAMLYDAGSYEFQVTVTDSTGLSSTDVVSLQATQTLAKIVITPPASMTTSSSQQLAATGLDQFGNPMATQPTFTWTASGGGTVSSGGDYTAASTAGNPTIEAASGTVNASTQISVTASPTITASPQVVSGTTTTLNAVGLGGAGYTYTWSVTSKPSGATTPTFSTNNSTSTSTAVTFFQAGNYTFEAESTFLLLFHGSATINVTVDQTLTSISISPATASINLNGSEQLTANGFDQFGKSMPISPAVQWSVTSGGGTIGSGGNYTAPTAATTTTILAASGLISSTATVSVVNAAPTVTNAVSSSSATQVTTNSVNLGVTATDDGGPANLTYTWSVIGSPPGTVDFSSNGINQAQTTTATVSVPGTYDFLVTITDSGGKTVTSSANINVPAAADQMPIVDIPSSQQTSENESLVFSPSSGNAVSINNSANATELVTMETSNGLLTLSSSSGLTFLSGTTGTNTGTISIEGAPSAINAALNGLTFSPTSDYSGPAGFVISATVYGGSSVLVEIPITIEPVNLPPTVATPAQASPSPVTGTSTNLSVLGADQDGEASLSYSWSVLSSPTAAPSPSFSLNGSNAAQNTVATFSAAGNYVLEATITDAGGLSTTSSVTVVVDQTLTSISVAPANGAIGTNLTQQFSATGLDQFGNAMQTQPTFSWSASAGSINAGGQYTAPGSAASATVFASSGGVTGSTSVTVVGNGTAIASPSIVSGSSTTLSVLNGATSGVTYTWSVISTPPFAAEPIFSINGSSSAQTTTATFFRVGSYTFQVAINNGSITTQDVTVTVEQALADIVVSPGTANLNENAQQQFSAVGYDQFGYAMVSQPAFAWAVSTGNGAIDGTGLYTAGGSGEAGSATITATSNSISGITTITVTNAAPTVATPAAASPSPVTGTSTSLSVLGADDGGESNLTYSWSTVGTPPAPVNFSVNNSNVAKNTTAEFTKAGTYQFLVTISDVEGLTATSTVDVVVDQTASSIAIQSCPPAMADNSSYPFTAIAMDQFGNPLTIQPAITWSVDAGGAGGTIDSAGVYTTPTAGIGVDTIRVSSGGVSGAAQVTITGDGIFNAGAQIGTPAVYGYFSENAGTYTVAGGGVDTPFGPDQYELAYQSFSGDCTMIAQVPSVNGTSTPATAGLMFRESLGTTSAYVSITRNGYSGSNDIGLEARLTPGGTAGNLNLISVSGATWLKLVRSGNNFTAYYGSNGTTWTQLGGTVTLSAGAGMLGGLVVSANPASTLSEATFTNVSMAADLAVAQPALANKNPVTTTTTGLSVLGSSTAGESTLSYTWAATAQPSGSNPLFSANGTNAAKDTTVTFNQPGDYTFICTITDGLGDTVTSSVNVTVDQTLTAITVLPSNVTLHQNQQQQYWAQGYDQFGDLMSPPPNFTWDCSALGSIDGSGLFSSVDQLGTGTITATAGAVTGATGITVINAPPTVAVAAAASPNVVMGTTTNLSVLGADDGGEPNLIYIWSTSGTAPAPVIFSANDTNSSKNTTATFGASGIYHFLVTIVDARGASTTSTVAVQVVPIFTSIAVTPANASLERAASEQFSATALDQFGVALVSQPAFTWSTLGNIGSIDSTGAYTAPDAGIGNATIIATSGNISGSTMVALIDDLSATVPAAQSAIPNQSVVFADANAISINDGDPNTESVPLSLTLAGTDGVISLSEQSGLTLSAGTGTDDATMTFTGNLSDINNALQGLTFTPNAGFTGSASMSVTINEVGIAEQSPSKTIDINVEPAAAASGPTTGSTAGGGAAAGSGGDSGIGDILNPPINSSGGTTGSPSSGGSSNVFSNSPIVGSPTGFGDTGTSAPLPAPAAPSGNSSQQNSSGSNNAPASAAPAPAANVAAAAAPAAVAAIKQPEANPTVPDVKVNTVPDQVFTFLAPQSPMLKNLDTVKSDMASEKSLKVAAGSATVVSLGASAAYFVWLLRGGSLLSSLLSIFPAWKAMDPLPVLDSYENSRKRRKGRAAIDAESLESMVDKSNQNAPRTNEEKLD